MQSQEVTEITLQTKPRSWGIRETPVHILHITDTEGTGHLRRSIQQSSIVCHDPAGDLDFVDSNQKSHFVFGGDASDRGRHTLRDLKLLNDFKMRYPDQVTLIAGNRDINKIRLRTELNPAFIRERLLHGETPRWLPHRPTRPVDYLLADMAAHAVAVTPDNIAAIQNYADSLSEEQCQLIYLHWMLEKTMGASHAFRYMREELQELSPHKNQAVITDTDVLKAFLQAASKKGPMGQYLELAQPAAIIPGTQILALHGGLSPANMGRIPDMTDGDPRIDDVHTWVKALNRWYQNAVGQSHSSRLSQSLQPAISALDDFILPLPGESPSIVITRLSDGEEEFMPPSPAVCDWLASNGIQAVFMGHNPSGDHPLILRDPGEKLLFVQNDTSYADPDPARPDNTRGNTAHVTEMVADHRQVMININAVLADGTKVRTALAVTNEGIRGDPWMGRVLADHWAVQCRSGQNRYRLAKKSGYQVNYRTISRDDMNSFTG